MISHGASKKNNNNKMKNYLEYTYIDHHYSMLHFPDKVIELGLVHVRLVIYE